MDRRRRFRLLVVAVSVAALLVGIVGLPVPTAVAHKDRSTPFPCQDSACGCMNAEQCWKDCCCHSPAERIAWAREHGVTPPASLTDAPAESTAPTRSCCHEGGCHSADEHADAATEPGDTWLYPSLVRRCQGHAELWQALGAITPPPALVLIERDTTPCDAPTVYDASPLIVFSQPDVPPPRG